MPRINWYEQRFWTAANICDLGQEGDLYTKTTLEKCELNKVVDLKRSGVSTGRQSSPAEYSLLKLKVPQSNLIAVVKFKFEWMFVFGVFF